MTAPPPLAALNILFGGAAAALLGHLLHSRAYVVQYRRFLRFALAGSLLLTGAASATLASAESPASVGYALGVGVVVAGLYDLTSRELAP